jgi:hypothetical protein
MYNSKDKQQVCSTVLKYNDLYNSTNKQQIYNSTKKQQECTTVKINNKSA